MSRQKWGYSHQEENREEGFRTGKSLAWFTIDRKWNCSASRTHVSNTKIIRSSRHKVNHLKAKIMCIVYQNTVCTSQRTHCASISGKESVNADWGKDRWLLWQTYGTHNRDVWSRSASLNRINLMVFRTEKKLVLCGVRTVVLYTYRLVRRTLAVKIPAEENIRD